MSYAVVGVGRPPGALRMLHVPNTLLVLPNAFARGAVREVGA